MIDNLQMIRSVPFLLPAFAFRNWPLSRAAEAATGSLLVSAVARAGVLGWCGPELAVACLRRGCSYAARALAPAAALQAPPNLLRAYRRLHAGADPAHSQRVCHSGASGSAAATDCHPPVARPPAVRNNADRGLPVRR